MHANLNKTASKTLLLPKDEEGKARKPRTFLHNLLKIRGAQTMAAVRNEMCWDGLGGWPRSTQSGKTAWNVFLFCRAQCTLQLPPPLLPCGTGACLLAQGIILWLVCIYFSFAWIFHCFPRRKAQTERTALHAPQDQHKHAIFVSGKSARKSTCNTEKSSAPLPLSQGSSQCLQCYPVA